MTRKKHLRVKRREKSVFKPIIRYVLLCLFIVSVYEITVRFAEPRILPIKHVKIDAKIATVDLCALKKRTQPYIKGFFSTNVMALKNEILAVPFVDEVVIKRVWPDSLLVTLTEITFVANWNGEKAVSSKGELVNIRLDVNKHLPLFQGPESQVAKMLAVYNECSATLRPLNVTIAAIKLNSRHSWQVTLDNGIKLFLGRKDLALHLHSFVAVYPKLKKIHGDNLESFDLRHTNGVSVHLVHTPKNQEQ